MENPIKMDDFRVPLFSETSRWWQLKYFFMFTPNLWELVQFDEHFFSDGLVQAPTREDGRSLNRCMFVGFDKVLKFEFRYHQHMSPCGERGHRSPDTRISFFLMIAKKTTKW